MRILYGAVGEGLGHATRSRVVASHLLDQGHEVKMAASGRAFPYPRAPAGRRGDLGNLVRSRARDGERLEDADGQPQGRRLRGVPADWHAAPRSPFAFGPELVLTDFDGFAYLFAKLHRKPVLSVDNIQMVDRCRHDGEILKGIRARLRDGPCVREQEDPRANHYLITTFFRPPLRKKRTTFDPPAPPPGNPGGEV